MLQDWLMVAPTSRLYAVSYMVFHNNGEANFSVTNCMSHFYMYVPTEATVNLANGIMGHSQVIRIIFCSFPILFHFISNGTSLLLSRSPFQHHLIRCPQISCWFSKGYIWDSWKLWLCWPSKLLFDTTLPDSKQFRLSSNINLSKSTLKEAVVFFFQIYVPYKNYTYQKIHQCFFHVSIHRLKLMTRKWLIEGLPTNLLDLE